MPVNTQAQLVIKKGVCHVLYAYDVGLAIDIEQCKKILTAGVQDGQVRQNRRAPKYFDYSPAPLLVTKEIPPISLGALQTRIDVDLLLYDFGGISVGYEIPISGTLDILRSTSCALSESRVLLEDSRRRVENILASIGAAIDKPGIGDLIEDYVLFQIDEYESTRPMDGWPGDFAPAFAQVLRAENQALSEQEVTDAMACRISFGRDDLTLIDWNGALIFDREAEDIQAVLEFANLELLEMRILDHQLDHALDRSYETLSRHTFLRKFLPGSAGAGIRRVSQMQVDGALLFERVSNAPKLLGDQYLARVYRLTAQRFHLSEWNASIHRKLDAIESIYKQMHDRAASWRLEALEWIIIVLIGFEIAYPFIKGIFHWP